MSSNETMSMILYLTYFVSWCMGFFSLIAFSQALALPVEAWVGLEGTFSAIVLLLVVVSEASRYERRAIRC